MDLGSLAREINIPVLSAFLLGVLATLGPCTMATNIAALAYISREFKTGKTAILTACLYTLGRMLTYSFIGALIIFAGMEISGASLFLQGLAGVVLGPFLIVIGIALLFIDRISFNAGNKLSDAGNKVARWGIIGGLPLGALFALAFCPYSAVLFFAVLIPLSFKTTGGVTLPAFFAIGTGLPVLIFGFLITLGLNRLANVFNAVDKAQRIVHIILASVFILIGLYYLWLWINPAA
jgi:cytochrome c-type biogenesis protein